MNLKVKQYKCCQLRNNEKLVIKILEPPLGEYIDRLYRVYIYDGSEVTSPFSLCERIRGGFFSDFWWDRVMNGKLARWNLDRFFVGEIDGKAVANIVYSVPRDTKDVGALGMVFTKLEHRRKGIASFLMEAAIRTFEEEGGLAMYLATANPAAREMYAKFGFTPYLSRFTPYLSNRVTVMRYLVAGREEFDSTYFTYDGKALVREADWGDLPRIARLYANPKHAWLIKPGAESISILRNSQIDFAKEIAEAEKGKGRLFVLENPRRRVVGVSFLTELNSRYEQRVKMMDFRIVPDYFRQSGDLLRATIEKASDTNTEIIEMCIAQCDEEKKEMAKRVGFMKEATLRHHFVTSEGRYDLEFYVLRL